MSIQFTVAGIGVIMAILIHAFYTVRWSARLETTVSLKIDQLTGSLARIDKELEKRDVQIFAAWKKIDGVADRVTRVEAQCNIKHTGDN